jgi:hypothetical protein
VLSGPFEAGYQHEQTTGCLVGEQLYWVQRRSAAMATYFAGLDRNRMRSSGRMRDKVESAILVEETKGQPRAQSFEPRKVLCCGSWKRGGI